MSEVVDPRSWEEKLERKSVGVCRNGLHRLDVPGAIDVITLRPGVAVCAECKRARQRRYLARQRLLPKKARVVQAGDAEPEQLALLTPDLEPAVVPPKPAPPEPTPEPTPPKAAPRVSRPGSLPLPGDAYARFRQRVGY